MLTAKPQLTSKQRAQKEIVRLEERLGEMKEKITKKVAAIEDHNSSDDELEPQVIISAKMYKHYL